MLQLVRVSFRPMPMKAHTTHPPFVACPARFNMAAHVLGQAKSNPDKVALSVLSLSGAERWSYHQLESSVLGVATGLKECGLVAGDIVLLRLGNSVDYPLCYLAAIASGIIPVALSAQLTENEVDRVVEELSPKAVLWDSTTQTTSKDIRHIDVNTLRDMRTLPPAEYDMGDPNRLAYIVYTSGTSGTPRAVMHAHRAIWARQMMIHGWYALGETDRVLHAGAFNWTFTMGTGLMDPWTQGATALIAKDGVPIEALPLLLKRHDATLFAAVPGVYRKLLKHADQLSLPSLRHGLAAGEKLSPRIRADWQAATQTNIYEAFGMSECSTFISQSPLSECAEHSLGHPQKGRQIAIIDPETQDICDIGGIGVIAVHKSDPGLMLGYYGAEAETKARFAGEWFLTGDLGEMTPDHSILYHGRSDDMMNAGGYRVSSIEVETQLNAFEGIDAVAVTDIEVKPDVYVIAAFYTAAQDIDEDALDTFAQSRLSPYKCPKIYRRLAQLPTNPNGKLQRRQLRDIEI